MTRSNIAITPAVPADASAIAALEKQCFSAPWSEEAVLSEITAENAVLLVAKADGTPVGYASFRYVLDEGYIGNIAVDSARRGEGIGGMLLKELIMKAVGKNLAFLTLEVRPSNTAAVTLYRSAGFTDAGRRKNYYQCPLEDALLLTLTF